MACTVRSDDLLYKATRTVHTKLEDEPFPHKARIYTHERRSEIFVLKEAILDHTRYKLSR